MSASGSLQQPIEALLRQARGGDAEALGELLAVYRGYLLFLARSQLHQHLRGKADPSDLAQEVCLEVHGHIDEFHGHSAEEFAAWLRGILANILAMHVRHYLGTQKRDPRREQAIDHGLATASGFLQRGLIANATSPSQHYARNEASLQLAEALERLPEDYRQVIVLRHIDGLPFAAVARCMHRSVDSVEKLWVRSLAQLKRMMGDVDVSG